MHQKAETGIWWRDMPKKAQKQHHKKVAGKQHNRNWQGSRRDEVDAVDQVFGANEVKIKRKSLDALRLLRQADQAPDKIHEFLANHAEYM
jgi:hypothetical protein